MTTRNNNNGQDKRRRLREVRDRLKALTPDQRQAMIAGGGSYGKDGNKG
ncbi:hypothetical protein ES703_49776 [subsurface metagenome]